jgi:hypothetical protein
VLTGMAVSVGLTAGGNNGRSYLAGALLSAIAKLEPNA